jgi:outer membrane biosynthesis protein TonB
MTIQSEILHGAPVQILTTPARSRRKGVMLLAGLLAACAASPTANAAPGEVGQATVEGALDKPAIREVVKANIGDVRECYNAELIDNEAVEGSSVISFVVRPDGSVSEIGIAESTMPERFNACMTTAVGGWSFPTSDAETRVAYPFVMSPG